MIILIIVFLFLESYRYYHAMILLYSAAASKEWYKEDYDTNYYHQEWGCKEPTIHKITVSAVNNQNHSTDRNKHDAGDLK